MYHKFRSPILDNADPNELGPDEWNDRHAERCFTNQQLVLGRVSILFSSIPGGIPFNANETNTDYAITISGNADEVFHWENKATTGFDVVSSNPSSTALVDVKISRQ